MDLLCLIYFLTFYPPTSSSGATLPLLGSRFNGSVILLKSSVPHVLCNLSSRLLPLKAHV